MFSQITVDTGICYALFAYDVAWAIDLDEAGRHIMESKERSPLRQERRAPQSFKYYPPLALQMTGRFRWPGSFEAEVQRIARFQIDSAVLFERVTNALKLLGDQYLARVYQLVSRRLHLSEEEANIIKKLQAPESIYRKMSDRATIRRMEVLEWTSLVLIAVSILLSLLPGLSGH